MVRPSALLLLVTLLLLPFTSRAQTAPAYTTDPKFIRAVAEAKEQQSKRQPVFALESYKKASKIAGGKDAAVLGAIYDLELASGDNKAAAAAAAGLDELAATPRERAAAEISRAVALYRQAGDKGKSDLLRAADDALKSAIGNDAKNASAYYLDGQVLARLGQMDAAKERFTACLSCLSPASPSYTRAQHFADNPALSTARMAPPFTVVSLDGSRFELDGMNGRVVLIDFWATWCGPCNAELPHMKKIAREFAGEPLVIISVSWDDDEAKWKNFIAKNEMTWVQYRDADHGLSKRFGVEAIPHYFTIDSDGVLTAEMLGSGSDVEGKLKKLVARAKVSRPPITASTGGL